MVTDDKYELPMMVCDSIRELSEKTGKTISCLQSLMSHHRRQPDIYKSCRYVRVEIEEET